VTTVAALAPWLPEGEPVEQLAGRDVLIAHGDRDRVTSSRLSAAYAQRARTTARSLRYLEVAGSGHALLGRGREWHRLVRRFCLGELLRPMGQGAAV
jgi:predicted esterase